MSDLKIVFFGSPTLVAPVLEILKQNFNVIKYIPDKDAYEQAIGALKELQPDLFIVAAFGKIIPQEVLDIPKFGSINVHPSLLPKFRGPTPVQAAILAGEQTSGVSVIKMDEQMDHGPVLAQKEMRLLDDDTAGSFYGRAFKEGAELLLEVTPDLVAGKLKLEPQNEAEATFCKLISKTDGEIDIQNPPSPEILNRMVRAYSPWPNVWTRWNGKVVKLYPGGQIQMEGKKPTDLKSFLNGYPDFPIKMV